MSAAEIAAAVLVYWACGGCTTVPGGLFLEANVSRVFGLCRRLTNSDQSTGTCGAQYTRNTQRTHRVARN